jgi:large subunit ribosomal protein L13
MDENLHASGYPGGKRALTAKVLQSKNPALLVEKAVKECYLKTKLVLNF